MNEARIARIAFAVTLWLAAVLPLCDTAVAQKANVSGVIVGTQRCHHDGQVPGRRDGRRPP